jgi:hypothetical protein
MISGLLGVLSMSVSLFVSPFVIAVCRRKSTRLTSVVGGLIITLGCLFASFATEFHQVFISFGVMVGKRLIRQLNSLSNYESITKKMKLHYVPCSFYVRRHAS